MKQYLFILSLAASCPVFAQTKHPSDADAAPRVNIPFEFTSEEENKLLKEDYSLKYFVANGDGTNTVCINDEQSYYKLLNKDHKVIAEGSFIAEGEKIVSELLNANLQIISIVATKDWIESESRISHKPVELLEANSEELKRLSCMTTPNKVIAYAEIPE